jgi:ABC-type transport system involved in multi-copper enzyme maturation permease subunit
MIWLIVKKEFLLSLMTFKFAVGIIVCVVLTAAFVPILAGDYEQRLRTCQENTARDKGELRQVKVYRNIRPTLFRPPCVLSVFSEGLEKRIDASATLELEEAPRLRGAGAQGNPYQSIFPVFDASLIFRIVISVLALLVAYDAISGERERDTLKLTLSSNVRRHEILLGKLLAGMTVLVVPVTAVFVIALAILLSFPLVELTGSDWGRIALMYLASLVFTAAMYNLGLLFSCLTRRSAVSLVLGLFVWVLFVIVVPNVSVYLASQMRAIEPRKGLDARIAALKKESERQIRENVPNSEGGSQSDAGDAFGSYYHRRLDEGAMKSYSGYYPVRYRFNTEYAGKCWEIERQYLAALAAQKSLAGRLSRVSPVCLYENLMSKLAGTDEGSWQAFIGDVKKQRDGLIDYVRAKTNDFAATTLFTPYAFEQMQNLQRDGKDPPLALDDLPDFAYRAKAAEDLRRAVPDLGLLVFVNLLLFALSFVAFLWYDVR